MSDELFRAFDECLSAVEAGASLESALARYPHLAAELRPMLLAAQAARPTEILRVPKQSEEASRQRFLARARELKQKRTGASAWWPTLSLGLRFAVFLLALVFGGWAVSAASASALPGEVLYPIKRAVEQVQVSLAAEAQRVQLQAEFNTRRLAEIQALLEQRREAEVEFAGVIAQTSGEQWVIAQLPVYVPAAVKTGFSVGDEVAVRARTQTDGALRALTLRLLASSNGEVTITPTLAVTPTAATATPSLSATPSITVPITTTRTPSPSRTASPTATRSATLTASATLTLVLPTQTPQPPSTDDDNGNDNDDNENDDDGNDNEGDDDNDNSGGGSGPSPSNTPKP